MSKGLDQDRTNKGKSLVTSYAHAHKRIRPKKVQCEPKQKDDGRHAGQVVDNFEVVRGNSEAWASREREGQKGDGSAVLSSLLPLLPLLLQYIWSVQSMKHAGLVH